MGTARVGKRGDAKVKAPEEEREADGEGARVRVATKVEVQLVLHRQPKRSESVSERERERDRQRTGTCLEIVPGRQAGQLLPNGRHAAADWIRSRAATGDLGCCCAPAGVTRVFVYKWPALVFELEVRGAPPHTTHGKLVMGLGRGRRRGGLHAPRPTHLGNGQAGSGATHNEQTGRGFQIDRDTRRPSVVLRSPRGLGIVTSRTPIGAGPNPGPSSRAGSAAVLKQGGPVGTPPGVS